MNDIASNNIHFQVSHSKRLWYSLGVAYGKKMAEPSFFVHSDYLMLNFGIWITHDSGFSSFLRRNTTSITIKIITIITTSQIK